jgi:branched-subunit amino acid aminotransferase/4-amino-4-deoxychorismate lyase
MDPTSCDPSALAGLGCFTTVRVEAGRPTYLQAHLLRLQRDARTLGLLAPNPEVCRRALVELAAAAFTDQPHQQGIIRLILSHAASSATSVVATARPLNPLPSQWQAIRATAPHPGPRAWGGAKLASRALYDNATQQALAANAQEALLFDEAERLIEGSISNLLFLLPDGSLGTPPLKRGPVAGIARELCLQKLPGLIERDLQRHELNELQCLFAINAVRGAVPISHLDGMALGTAEAAVREAWLEKIGQALRWEESS